MYEKTLLAGKIAVVTGGGTGLGKAVASALARHGADVALAARDGERLDAAAAAIRKATGRRAIGVPTDVSDAKAVSKLFDEVEAGLGPVSILINGAAA
ncbi:MAG: SDR family NAD(P)-dependent oxidoreductase, partial [Elusimicrobia bacterium]|nr:SDR family NAD(P)-dependent oxidoreductase [Elusimicrobiota bacterium]